MNHSRRALRLGVVAIFLTLSAPALARELTLEQRVAAQKAVEQVYWEHRVWPQENPQPKPPLSAVLTDDAIRTKVVDTLRKSNALERLWERPVTAEQLQAELTRMSRQSRNPALLQELYDALDNDPFLIAETLGRSTLVERLIRNWYSSDTRFHGELRARAEQALSVATRVDDFKMMGGEFREGTLTREEWSDGREGLEETADAFVVRAVRSESDDKLVVWTVTWPKRSFDAWWSDERPATSAEVVPFDAPYVVAAPLTTACTNDTWADTENEPVGRSGHIAIWTGTEMIVWGGRNTLPVLTGSRYNPATDSWTPISPFGSVWGESAVWTGTEMIVWAGHQGGRYNPSTDTWAPTSTGAGCPTVTGAGTVWAGTEMIVWGGFTNQWTNTGARYNPSTDSWTVMSTGANVPSARGGHRMVWTGSEMLVYGGQAAGPTLFNGGRYSPASDTWAVMTPPQPALSFPPWGPAVWTGTEMIVWGGTGGSSGVGGRYKPSTDSWSATSITADTPSYRTEHALVWTGTEMIVWGGRILGGATPGNDGGRYDPATDSWTKTSVGANVPTPRHNFSAAWTGTEMIVWGGSTGPYVRTGGRYHPSSNSWVPTSFTPNIPTQRSGNAAVWTGTEMIVWGGGSNTGGRYDLATASWTPTSLTNAPTARSACSVVWTGTEMIVWGGGTNDRTHTGGRYNPTTNTWFSTNEHNSPSLRGGHTAVWTGSRMIIWGGIDGIDGFSGGRYDPATDSWVSTSGVGAPQGRSGHSAVWTGTNMIVWGGVRDAVRLNTGGRYDPSTDAWTPTSVGTNVPSARNQHRAVWTGTEMIVWGGALTNSSFLNSGGRYSPATDAWTPTSNAGSVPTARGDHSAQWTGNEMLVWGGGTTSSKASTGARYVPTTDTWTPTSNGVNTPVARAGHTAVWTGSESIVWGGNVVDVNPGIYCACPSGLLVFRDADGDGYGTTVSVSACDGSIPAGYVTATGDCNDASAAAHPGGTEICDALDNNCNGTVDDGGSAALCNDADGCTDDVCGGAAGCSHAFNTAPCNDGQLCTNNDVCQLGTCSGVAGPPAEIQGVTAAGHVTTTLTWTGPGGGTTYDVMSSTLSDLAASGTSTATCLADDVPVTAYDDARPNPAAGEGVYYLIRAQNQCGDGGYGFGSEGEERLPIAPCP